MTERTSMTNDFEQKLFLAAQVPGPRPEFVVKLRRELGAQHPLRLPWYRICTPYLSKAIWAVLLMLLALGLVVALNLIMGDLRPNVHPLAEQTPTAEISPTPKPDDAETEPKTDETELTAPLPSSLFGYMDWVGVVEDLQAARYLPEPVTVEREGVAVTVLAGLLDVNQSVFMMEVNGLSILASNSVGEGGPTGSGNIVLSLPDGSSYDTVDGDGNGWGTGYRNRAVFPPLPLDVTDVTLQIEQLQNMPAGTAPEDWVIPLRLEPLENGDQIKPAYHARQEWNDYPGLQVNLDWIVPVQDGYLFSISSIYDDVLYPHGISYDDPIALDAAGNELPVQRTTTFVPHYRRPNFSQVTFKMGAPSVSGELRIVLPAINVWDRTEHSFELDLGGQPYPGQSIPINQEFRVGEDVVYIHSAQVIQWLDDLALLYDVEADPEKSTLSIGIRDPEHSVVASSTDSLIGFPGHLAIRVKLNNSIPAGKQEGALVIVSQQKGQLIQFAWEPPAEIAIVQPPDQDPCLTLEGWRQMEQAEPEQLPDGLGGRLLLYDRLQGSQDYGIILSNLDGSQRQELGKGVWPALSPDGNQIVYSGELGLTLQDLETGVVKSIAPDGYSPVWSPDGKTIALTRQATEFDIWTVTAEGSDLRQVTNTLEYEMPKGWTRNGSHILYTVERTGGQQWLESIDPLTGMVERLVQMPDGKSMSPAFSPDGNWMAYEGPVFGKLYSGIYLARSDGSEPRLLVSLPSEVSVFHPIWSPDGKWLLLSTGEFFVESGVDHRVPFLIQPDTCQVIRLNISGEVNGWSPLIEE
jgi:hypothetical protein